MPDDVGNAANGWLGLEERADGVPVGMELALRFPARNSVRGDAEASRGFPLSPTEEALHPKNPESVLGRIVSAMVPMDLLNVFDEDLGDLPVGVEQSLQELGVGDGVLERVVLIAPRGDLDPESKTEKSMGFEHGLEGWLGNFVTVREVLKDLIGELVGGGDGRYHSSPPEIENVERFSSKMRRLGLFKVGTPSICPTANPAYRWGLNGNAQLGEGTTQRTSPVRCRAFPG
jgi:hypothetical protein